VIKERNNPEGYEHRAPKRRVATPPNKAAATTATAAATTATATNNGASFMQAWLQTANPPMQLERKCLIDMTTLE
jgi:hypothetical protein